MCALDSNRPGSSQTAQVQDPLDQNYLREYPVCTMTNDLHRVTEHILHILLRTIPAHD